MYYLNYECKHLKILINQISYFNTEASSLVALDMV